MIKIIVYFVTFVWILISILIILVVKLIINGVSSDDCERAIGCAISKLGLSGDNINFYARQYNIKKANQ